MPEKHLYEYAVIRIVPRVDREEFLNAGLIIYCKQARYISVRYTIDKEKLRLLCPDIDIEEVEAHLAAFEKIGRGAKDGGTVALEDAPSRFRWLTAVRSTVIQTSRPHQGFSLDLSETAERLFQDLVL